MQTSESGNALVVSVAGRVDGVNAEIFKDDLAEEVEAFEGRSVVLDLTDLTYISSAGLRSVLLIAKLLKGKRMKFVMCSLTKDVDVLIRTSGFDRVIDVYGSSSEAVSAVTG